MKILNYQSFSKHPPVEPVQCFIQTLSFTNIKWCVENLSGRFEHDLACQLITASAASCLNPLSCNSGGIQLSVAHQSKVLRVCQRICRVFEKHDLTWKITISVISSDRILVVILLATKQKKNSIDWWPGSLEICALTMLEYWCALRSQWSSGDMTKGSAFV